MTFVLDASATIPWFLHDEVDPAAEARFDRLRAYGAVVPALWHLEVGNVLLMAFRRKRMTKEALEFALGILQQVPLDIDRNTARHSLGTTFQIATELDLTLYDAAYIELASRRGLPLATNDKALLKAALARGIPLA